MPNFHSIFSSLKSNLRSTRRGISKFIRPQSFSIPTKSTILPRIKRNISYFKIHYIVLLWISLLLSLYSHHKPTMFFLMAGSKVAIVYEVLMKMVPGSWKLIRRVLDRRLVVGAFVGAILVEIAVTGAIGRVALAVAVSGPVVSLHALFRAGEDLDAEGTGEADLLGEKKVDADLESGR